MIKKILFLSALCIFTSGMLQGQTKQLYALKCGICHTIGKGKLVGPDLLNVHDRHSDEWLLKFVRSSQKMVQSGDSAAVALFKENNNMIMPDPMIPDEDILSILAFIADSSASGVSGGAGFASILTEATPENATHGHRLFVGRVRFENGGPSCISCHNINRDSALFETNYAKGVMGSFENLGEAGVMAILNSPPFPVMAAAFKGHDLTDSEVHDLLVYLRDAKTQSANVEMSSLYSNFLVYGAAGGLLLFVLYSLLWYNRREGSVNNTIYKRQIKSTN
jgi:mono/diheme cytochrome c family protein